MYLGTDVNITQQIKAVQFAALLTKMRDMQSNMIRNDPTAATIMHRNGAQGISLVGVAISLFILSLATFLFMKSQGNFLSVNEQVSQSLKGEEVLVGVTADLQDFDFERIVSLCKEKKGMKNDGTGTDSPGECLVGEKLDPKNKAEDYVPGEPVLGFRLNERKRPDETGRVCVEIKRCDFLAANNVLDLQIRGHWLASPGDERTVSRVLMSRRVRR